MSTTAELTPEANKVESLTETTALETHPSYPRVKRTMLEQLCAASFDGAFEPVVSIDDVVRSELGDLTKNSDTLADNSAFMQNVYARLGVKAPPSNQN